MSYAIPLGHGTNAGPCLCGATDCSSCGPAQGYHGRDDDEYDVEAAIESLMAEGAEYYPLSGKALSEAVGEMSDGHWNMLAQRLRDGNEHEAFVILKHCAKFYWSELARKHAQEKAREARGVCLACQGDGCPACSWLGRPN